VNPVCPTRENKAQKQRIVENMRPRRKLAGNTAHNRMLMEEVQSVKDIGASMAALLSSEPDSRYLTPQEYQDKFKQMAALFTLMSSTPPEVNGPASVAAASTLNSEKPNKLVRIEAPVREVSFQDVAKLTLAHSPQVASMQPEKQHTEEGGVKGLTPANILKEVSDHSPM
jgi:hypothetical protein